jgi:DNA modification methylase
MGRGKAMSQTYLQGSYSWHLPIENVQTWIVDPPYNIGFNYHSDFSDKMTKQDYSDLHYDFLELAHDSSKDGASFFLINYPEIIAEYYHTILESSWNVHQWITWVYPSNIGMSKNKFTRASRTVLWLTKGKPFIDIKAVQQPYKNPNDKRVKKMIENGSTGTNLYDWQEINLCKNVSKDKNDYVNQIPQELLNRLILTTSQKGDLIADLMCGSGSTVVAADKLGRNGWGCDINPNLLPIWEKNMENSKAGEKR